MTPLQDLLTHQVRTARWHADRQFWRRWKNATLSDVVDSLQWTQAWLFHPDAEPAFVWDSSGVLKLHGRAVPLDGRYLADRFLTAGIRPAPGQVFALPPRLVIEAITDALGGLDRDRSALEQALETLDVWLARGGSDDPNMIREAIRIDRDTLSAIKAQTIRLITARATAEELVRPPPQVAARRAA